MHFQNKRESQNEFHVLCEAIKLLPLSRRKIECGYVLGRKKQAQLGHVESEMHNFHCTDNYVSHEFKKAV